MLFRKGQMVNILGFAINRVKGSLSKAKSTRWAVVGKSKQMGISGFDKLLFMDTEIRI